MPNLKPSLRTLPWVAWGGLAVVLIGNILASLPWKPRQGYGLVLLALMCVAVMLVSLVLMQRAIRTLGQHKDLLLPLAWLTVALQFLEWLAAVPFLGAVFGSSWPLQLFNLSIALSLQLVIHLVLFLAYATWVTAAIIAVVRTGDADPNLVWLQARKHFWRVFGLEFVGGATVLVASGGMLLLLPVIGAFAFVPMVAFAVGWNYATAAVLPMAFENGPGFWTTLRAGIRVSLANARKWWLLLLAQMLLLGLVMFFYSHWDEGGSQSTNVSWNINAFWTGGYESDCRWYGKLVEIYKTSKLPFVEALLALLFGVMAVMVKIAIVQRLPGEPTPDAPRSPSASTVGPES